MALQLKELDDFCDSLDRPGNVQVVLHIHASRGFSMTVTDGVSEHLITGEHNRPHYFRTIEMVLDELANIPYISEKIILHTKHWYR